MVHIDFVCSPVGCTAILFWHTRTGEISSRLHRVLFFTSGLVFMFFTGYAFVTPPGRCFWLQKYARVGKGYCSTSDLHSFTLHTRATPAHLITPLPVSFVAENSLPSLTHSPSLFISSTAFLPTPLFPPHSNLCPLSLIPSPLSLLHPPLFLSPLVFLSSSLFPLPPRLPPTRIPSTSFSSPSLPHLLLRSHFLLLLLLFFLLFFLFLFLLLLLIILLLFHFLLLLLLLFLLILLLLLLLLLHLLFFLLLLLFLLLFFLHHQLLIIGLHEPSSTAMRTRNSKHEKWCTSLARSSPKCSIRWRSKARLCLHSSSTCMQCKVWRRCSCIPSGRSSTLAWSKFRFRNRSIISFPSYPATSRGSIISPSS